MTMLSKVAQHPVHTIVSEIDAITHNKYHQDLTDHENSHYLDSEVWAHNADQDQTAPRSSLIRVYIVCHSIYLFSPHFCIITQDLSPTG